MWFSWLTPFFSVEVRIGSILKESIGLDFDDVMELSRSSWSISDCVDDVTSALTGSGEVDEEDDMEEADRGRVLFRSSWMGGELKNTITQETIR